MELMFAWGILARSPHAEGQRPDKVSSSKMIKSFVALAISSLLGTAIVALPAFAPQAKAGEAVAAIKADRLRVGPVHSTCSQQVWPDFETYCLRNHETGTKIRETRLVTARR